MIPCVGIMLYLGYQTHLDSHYPYAIWIVIPLILLVLLYLFKPQIDYWWHTKYPLKVDKELKSLLKKMNPYYASLIGDEKEKFEYRLALYMEGRAFKAVGHEHRDLPYDISGLISAIPIQLTMHKKDFLIGDIDRIFTYKHPFPTPQNQFLHSVETHVEDGVIILSLEAFNLAQTAPEQFYHIGWHAYIEVFLQVYKDDPYKLMKFANWETIKEISGFSQTDIENIVGIPNQNPLVPLCVLYFTHREQFKDKASSAFSAMDTFFS